MLNSKDLLSKDKDSLGADLIELRKTQANMRFKKTSGTLEKTHEQRNVRRDIARIKTILKQKEGK